MKLLCNENFTTFGCRLETLKNTSFDDRTKCSNSKELKAQTRHKYDSIEDFDNNLAEIQTVEKKIYLSPAINEKQAYLTIIIKI